MTIVRHSSVLLPTDITLHADGTFPVDLGIVCLWSLLGLMFSSFFLVWGSGVDIAQVLMAAG